MKPHASPWFFKILGFMAAPAAAGMAARAFVTPTDSLNEQATKHALAHAAGALIAASLPTTALPSSSPRLRAVAWGAAWGEAVHVPLSLAMPSVYRVLEAKVVGAPVPRLPHLPGAAPPKAMATIAGTTLQVDTEALAKALCSIRLMHGLP
jgi:hypothetical protein